MYNEIDLHNLDFRLALSIFKRKYNEALKRKDKKGNFNNSWLWS